MFAYDYPVLGLFWTMLILFLWIAWIMVVFRIFVDIFRSDDLGGWGKALWSVLVIFLPFLGVFVYLIARGQSMTERDIATAEQGEAAFRSYVQQAAGGSSAADQLATLADLRSQGVLSDAEFEAQKNKLLA